ncbi:MAG: DNA repair protein RecN, partial [Bacteroidetes bacterium]|nr:DNA repair protein RecN [Bacteroidota bacterium]
MLKSLSIRNYALIQQLDIDFNSGLSIISGETGAGKSIILGALSLILGQRADKQMLRNKEKKCVVEGAFGIKEYKLQEYFRDNDLDYDELTTLRREINSNGKSRAFVNDTPVKLNILRDLSLRLIDIHSQHENLELTNNLFQLNVVDVFARHSDMVEDYIISYKQYRELEKKLTVLNNTAQQSKQDIDYFQFQFNQLEEAHLESGEQEKLEEELETLNHAEEIKTNLGNASFILANDENALLARLHETVQLLGKLKSYFSKAGELFDRLESSHIELKDIAVEIEQLDEEVEHNPNRATEVNERLDLIYSLQQKHRAETVDELIGIKEELQKKIDKVTSYDAEIEKLEKELDSQKGKLKKVAAELRESRLSVIPEMESHLTRMLRQLGMPNGKFRIEHKDTDDYTPTGIDRVIFLFSANKQSDLQDISVVASGGELSRVMLSLKSLITGSSGLPTIFFDEIDSGVSGDIADRVGNILGEMALNMQVINITHLPQIASKGKNHYKVYKKDEGD